MTAAGGPAGRRGINQRRDGDGVGAKRRLTGIADTVRHVGPIRLASAARFRREDRMKSDQTSARAFGEPGGPGDFEVLTVGDGKHRAYVRIPQAARAGVVVLHAWWGLNHDVMTYADRIAAAGYGVVAPDMFRGQVATEIAHAERLSAEGDAAGADAITLAAVDALVRRLPGGAPLAILGFSFGAGYAIWAPSERQQLVASVVYYGAYSGNFVSGSTAALLGHFAERDEFTPDDEIGAMEVAFAEAGREITIHRYPDTGHWFAEPSVTDAYRPEPARLAENRTLEFLARTLVAPD